MQQVAMRTTVSMDSLLRREREWKGLGWAEHRHPYLRNDVVAHHPVRYAYIKLNRNVVVVNEFILAESVLAVLLSHSLRHLGVVGEVVESAQLKVPGAMCNCKQR